MSRIGNDVCKANDLFVYTKEVKCIYIGEVLIYSDCTKHNEKKHISFAQKTYFVLNIILTVFLIIENCTTEFGCIKAMIENFWKYFSSCFMQFLCCLNSENIMKCITIQKRYRGLAKIN